MLNSQGEDPRTSDQLPPMPAMAVCECPAGQPMVGAGGGLVGRGPFWGVRQTARAGDCRTPRGPVPKRFLCSLFGSVLGRNLPFGLLLPLLRLRAASAMVRLSCCWRLFGTVPLTPGLCARVRHPSWPDITWKAGCAAPYVSQQPASLMASSKPYLLLALPRRLLGALFHPSLPLLNGDVC